MTDADHLTIGFYSFLCTQTTQETGDPCSYTGARARETGKGHVLHKGLPRVLIYRVSLLGIDSFTYMKLCKKENSLPCSKWQSDIICFMVSIKNAT